MEGSFADHVVQATLPVLKICLLGAVGACLARMGILEQHGRKTLSKLIYCLFTPALTFTKLAPVLSGPHLLLWLPLVINMFVSVGAGLLLGVLLLVVVRPPAALRKHVVVAAALGNAGNLPLVLVAALIRETGGKLFGGEVMSEDLAIAYVAMGIWAATITHFTIGTEMLKLTPEEQQLLLESQSGGQDSGLLSNSAAGSNWSAAGGVYSRPVEDSSSGMHAAPATKVGSGDDPSATCVVELGVVRPTGQHQQQQRQQQQQPGQLRAGMQGPDSSSIHRAHSSTDCLVLATPVAVGSSKGCECVACGTDSPPAAAGGAAWQCPLCSAYNQALAVPFQQQHPTGWSPQQQQQSWQHDVPDMHAQEQTLLLAAGPHSSDSHWQKQAAGSTSSSRGSSGSGSSSGGGSGGGGKIGSSRVRRVGQLFGSVLAQLASPPMVGCIVAVVVGLIRPVRDQLFAPEGKLLMIQDCISMFGDCCIPCLLLMLGATLSKGPGKACPPLRVVAGVAAARLVLLPLLGTGWLVLAKKLGWYSAPDKMFILVMLIQNAVPTALNVHTLATLHSNKEAEMGAMLFWQYLAACITLPAALSFFLWLLNTPLMSA